MPGLLQEGLPRTAKVSLRDSHRQMPLPRVMTLASLPQRGLWEWPATSKDKKSSGLDAAAFLCRRAHRGLDRIFPNPGLLPKPFRRLALFKAHGIHRLC